MGCFSYFCQHCDKPIVHGEGVKLWLLQRHQILEEREGNYNSYGYVDGQPIWENDWGKIVDLHYSDYPENGIAAIHTECWENGSKALPTEKSEDDPSQGSGEIVMKKAPMSSSMFYSFIDEENLAKRYKQDIELNSRLVDIIKKTEELLEKIDKKDKEA